ncbi:hypothetical protein ATE47_01725 [Chryseobacterium sp. IHB B 17019]|nr:hypothetical protein ATE47_01725 [Chryseobacterium sp. IHB B 17019]
MEKKTESFEQFFKENRNKLPYYFKDLKATKLVVDDNNITINKIFNSNFFNSKYCIVERFYKDIVRL